MELYKWSISLAGQIIVKMNMNGRHILLLWRHFKLFIEGGLIYYTVVFQVCLHVQDFSLSLPSVTLSMDVYLLISVKNFPDSFLLWDFQLIFSVAQSIDDPDKLWLSRELTDTKALIFPPRNEKAIFFGINMKVLSVGYVELLFSVFVDKGSRRSSLFIKPMCDISACSLNERFNFRNVSIALNKSCQIVDITKESNPDIIGSVMTLQFREYVILSFFIRLGNQFFRIICCTLFAHKKYIWIIF